MTHRATDAHAATQAARRTAALFGVALFAAAFACPAMAYVGPGAGMGILGALLAILLAIVATVVGIVLWPVRAITRRLKAKRDTGPQSGETH